VSKTPEHGEFLKKGAFVIRGERRYFKDVPLGIGIGIADGVLIGGPVQAVNPKSDPVVEVEPGEFNADDLAKRIYRMFSENIEDRAYLKSIASVDQIVQFLPPGDRRVVPKFLAYFKESRELCHDSLYYRPASRRNDVPELLSFAVGSQSR
jgi:hypothetical protein